MINVLIIDDSITIRAMLTHVLQGDREIKVAVAENVAEAEILIDANHFDVITLDHEMPGMSGLDFLRILKARHDAPVIMLSSNTGKGAELRTKALMEGAVGCFDKAEAVRKAPELIKLVKAAAHRKTRIAAEDAAAVRERERIEEEAASAMGVAWPEGRLTLP